jgi:hypothetical protein
MEFEIVDDSIPTGIPDNDSLDYVASPPAGGESNASKRLHKTLLGVVIISILLAGATRSLANYVTLKFDGPGGSPYDRPRVRPTTSRRVGGGVSAPIIALPTRAPATVASCDYGAANGFWLEKGTKNDVNATANAFSWDAGGTNRWSTLQPQRCLMSDLITEVLESGVRGRQCPAWIAQARSRNRNPKQPLMIVFVGDSTDELYVREFCQRAIRAYGWRRRNTRVRPGARMEWLR